MSNIEPKDNLKDGPILIIQKKDGLVFDFGFVIKENDLNFFVGVQTGLNKIDQDIVKYITQIKENEKDLIANVSKLTKRTINQIRFIIIFDKESQENLQKEFDKIYSQLKDFKENKGNKKTTNYEQKQIDTKQNKINHYKSQFGIACCENYSITCVLFSVKDLRFYMNHNIVENFNVLDINPIKDSFELFCCLQYKLIPCKSEVPILNDFQRDYLLTQIQSDNSNIKRILLIQYELPMDLPFSMGTPPNTGILTITKEMIIFTYFYKNKFIHYTFNKTGNFNLKKYFGDEFLFNKEYDFESSKRYFIFLKLNLENEKDNEIYYKNKLRFIQKKRMNIQKKNNIH